ncbi:MAG: hypothetical protein PQJ59_16680 [Spirochaetales bacterium]|nr:hypothetical protein [Spirochaetales bacterium]
MRAKITVNFEKVKGEWQNRFAAIALDDLPEPGKVYELVEIDEASDKQRKLFEPLCRLYFNSFCYPHEVKTWEDLRDDIKKRLGLGYSHLEYVDENYQIVTIPFKNWKESIPEKVLLDFQGGNKYRLKGILRSTTTYSSNQFFSMTDSMIREMIYNNVIHSKMGKKFDSILKEIGFEE